MNEEKRIQDIKQTLESFLQEFAEYEAEVDGEHRSEELLEMRSNLQRKEPKVTKILIEDQGGAIFRLEHIGDVQLQALLQLAVAGGNNEDPINFDTFKNAARSVINHALGKLDVGLWPEEKPQPVLKINDDELRDRCTDLLKAPRNYDRVVREATIVLEDRIRKKPSHEVLSRLIPNSSEQNGRNLIDTLFKVDSPILSISDDRNERLKFRDILIGVISYLRNPYHHYLDDNTEWSWAWSTVGFIDVLLNEVDSCKIIEH